MMAIWKPTSGETPIDDISGLIPKNIATRRQLAIAEAENIRQAAVRYLAGRPTKRQAPFTLDWSYKPHAQMFGKVWRWAGTKRATELNIGVPAAQIDVGLHDLLDDLLHWSMKTNMSPEEQAARLHHRSVQIHPFLNGNGRWSRMLAKIWLKRLGHAATEWPDETVGEESVIRRRYLRAIRSADNGDLAPLIDLHARYTPPNRK